MIATSNRNSILKRRSSRIALSASVRLSGQDREKCTFTLGAKATNLNRHGAAVVVDRELLIGSTILVGNNHGNHASARVVAQVNVAHGVRIYGIEFLEESDKVKTFWGITFPPTV